MQRVKDTRRESSSQASDVERVEENERDRAIDEARRKRFEERRQSQFVGFGNRQKEEEPSLHFRNTHEAEQKSSEAKNQHRQTQSSGQGTSNTQSHMPPRSKTPRAPIHRISLGEPEPQKQPNAGLGENQESLSNAPGVQRQHNRSWARWKPADLDSNTDALVTYKAARPSTVRSVVEHDWQQNDDHNRLVAQMEYPVGTQQLGSSMDHAQTENRMARRQQELEDAQNRKDSKRKISRFAKGRASRSSQLRDRERQEFEDTLASQDPSSQEARRERKQRNKQRHAEKKLLGPPTPIYLPEFIGVGNLAGALHIRLEDFTDKMQDLGFQDVSNDHILDAETAGLIASEFNYEPIKDQTENLDLVARPPAEDKSLFPLRPPVVTIMGHVDHGKTTLLDWLRKSSVAATEHGGITQHIGAFSVQMPSGRTITFLDTPGHAAFLDMRQRGANVTDIVILVVAADDSVKPQTIEAIKHAQAAQVPMIVAVNKVDKDDANVDRVKQDLARYGVEIEDYGGDTQVVCVSGKTGQGMETLEESAVALADVLDMRAELDGPAEGWVLEATKRKAGRVATILVRRGTLHKGDIVVAGTTWARVRALRNEAGVIVDSAGPGIPVEVDGWKDQPAQVTRSFKRTMKATPVPSLISVSKP